MLCRRLRIRPWPGIASTLVACLALIGGIAVIPATWSEEETPSLTPTNHDLPLIALANSTGVRVAKQAQSHRPFIKKPDRSGRLSAPGRGLSLRPWNPALQAFRALPRRSLYAPRSRPSSPDDPSHPLLS